MDKMQYYTSKEAFYRKQAVIEPGGEKHIADADAWMRLADIAHLISVKHAEMRDWMSVFAKPK